MLTMSTGSLSKTCVTRRCEGRSADAFEKMWRNREEVDATRAKSYLFTVAYHQMIDHIRKVKRVALKKNLMRE
jgi:DNA-directed RNA polymerase specialized sigma24 family protein